VPANILDRQFEAERPNQKWIADFIYIWTAKVALRCGRDRPVLTPACR
jgi:transposase InsO family protein